MISDIADQLNERIGDLAMSLLGEPNRDLSTKGQLRFGSKGSVAIEIAGPKKGRWYDHENGAGGDGLELIRRTKGIANGEAAGWGREWLGLPAIGANGATPGTARKARPKDAHGHDDGGREAKVGNIIAGCTEITGTAAELYLRDRGITAMEWPSTLRYRPNAYGSYGALVALATDADGEVHAVQQIYLTDDGRKAPVQVQKRTNKMHDGWSDVAAVRLPGKQPLVLAEGVENALSVWQATGLETWACLGAANISKNNLPAGCVFVAFDGDHPDSPAHKTLQRAVEQLRCCGNQVQIGAPPVGKDFNDLLRSEGEEAIRAVFQPCLTVPAPKPDWRDTGLLRNKQGDPLPVLSNAIHAFRTAPEWQDVLVYDEFGCCTLARQPPPWDATGGASQQSWSDHFDVLATDWLQKNQIMVHKVVTGQAVEAVARDANFHPVRAYLDRLEWDGRLRVGRWLSAYLGAAETPYNTAIGPRWLISAVARIYKPGVQADCMLILEGAQGIRKSSALRVLGGDWFTDRISEPGSKDAAIELGGAWIVEMAELDSISRSDASTIKAFISRCVDRFRPPYGTRTVERPRQCVFAGSVNPDGGYLKDPTGARRFWPVACGSIDIGALERDRDQIWAEARDLYRAGNRWWLDTPELEALSQAEQASRYQGDPWETAIHQYLDRQGSEKNCYRATTVECGESTPDVSIAEILEHAVRIERSRWTQSDQNRVSRVLTNTGFNRYKARLAGGGREWRYRKTSVSA